MIMMFTILCLSLTICRAEPGFMGGFLKMGDAHVLSPFLLSACRCQAFLLKKREPQASTGEVSEEPGYKSKEKKCRVPGSF